MRNERTVLVKGSVDLVEITTLLISECAREEISKLFVSGKASVVSAQSATVCKPLDFDVLERTRSLNWDESVYVRLKEPLKFGI